MSGTLSFLGLPVLETVILAGILSYFGNHILNRGLVFIDIAVAQIAALGTMIGILVGFAEDSAGAQLSSYLFTIIVLGIFSMMKVRNQLLPQEAIIGIFYCLALGLALLLAEKIPGGSNYITKTITGNVLWVTWKTVISTILLLLPIVLILFIFGKGFREITESGANGGSMVNGKTRLLEFIFYLSFGIVIVKAVPVMGVFLVFILLIAPAAISRIFVSGWYQKVLLSWIIGSVASVAGIYISYYMNISNGPAIVTLLGILVYFFAFSRLIRANGNKVPDHSKNISS